MYKAPFNDVRVRQALNYGVDRDATFAGLIDGLGIPAGSTATGPPLVRRDLRGLHLRPAEAKGLLAEAGFKTASR